MRFGYWMPIFGGWLRNVTDEGMPLSWPYTRDLAAESEQLGFDLSLIAELEQRETGPYSTPQIVRVIREITGREQVPDEH